ncbi:MAG TPA: tRNA preQ1(34) S-adenosylmethionine ribosyltransferase-isomerase QueA [Gemmatimonadales bacterium]|nr:tRNA preQ1(34) S-adenosylmethionine ribosyltransferase-isomerase QueA [Gemmatimonadales bacterium]
MTPERLRTADFEYELPPDLIAQEPLPDRGGSRLLLVRRDARRLVDSRFTDLPSLISAGDLLVVNTSRVRHARLSATRRSGAPAEVLLIHPGPDGTWIAMGKPGSALRPGKRVGLGPGEWIEIVEVLDDGNRMVRFIGVSPEEAMRRYGRLPLPPYIARAPNELDETRYQTVYAAAEGSIAAPTAGLHFTPALLEGLKSAGVTVEGLDLQVGPGTFKPVEVDDPAEHPMHPERYQIPSRLAELVTQVRTKGGKVWAVGTTVVRALESAALGGGTVAAGAGETRLMITPGYTFRVVDRLLTNFHLPRSTLLMLVAAFAGRELTLAAYRHAVAARYRFYSYGDAMVII